MDILYHISPDSLITTYQKVRRVLQDNDPIIFDAMVTATAGTRRVFILPSNPSEFAQKHDEIVERLRYPNALKGIELIFQLMGKIWEKTIASSGIPGVNAQNLLDVISFQTTSDDVFLRLTRDGCWAVEWLISFPVNGHNERSSIKLEVLDKDWREIVPMHTLQFIHSALHAYKIGMNIPALALLAICVEATLRDVLKTKGYSFNPRASTVDEYYTTEADVGIHDNSYTVTFREGAHKPIKLPGDFLLSTEGSTTVPVQIRRSINSNKERVDLEILTPFCLIDHWSSNDIKQLAKKRVNGLGEALHIARKKEKFLSPDLLPEDFDDVIKVVRNNLMHASTDALNTPLLAFDGEGNFTLKNFLEDSFMVYDLVANIPKFINKQYIALRKTNISIP